MKKILVVLLCIVCLAYGTDLSAQTEVLYEEVSDSLLIQQDSVEIKLSTRDYFDMLTTPDVLTGAVINIYQDSVIFAAIDKTSGVESISK